MNKKQTFLWASLAMGGPIAPTLVGHPSVARADSRRDQAFAASGYTYCDAVVLASRWQQQPLDVKVTIGRKVSSGGGDVVKTELGRARAAAMKDPSLGCRFWDAGFEYSDAEKLARIWKVSVDAAKTMVEKKILFDGGEKAIHALLAQAAPAAPADEADPFDVYAKSGYSYCDAKLLASHWATSIDDSKSTIGRKIGWGNDAVVKDDLRAARAEALKDPRRRCAYGDTEFDFADAQKLAGHWRTSVEKAKALVEQKVLVDGGEDYLRTFLGKAQPAPPPPPPPPPRHAGRDHDHDGDHQQELAAFFSSGYGYCDAKVLAGHWGVDVEESKATVGRKIGWGNADIVKNELQAARTEAQRDRSRGCSFAESPFSYDDAQRLSRMWKTSVDNAKALVEQKILTDGGELRIRALLSHPTR